MDEQVLFDTDQRGLNKILQMYQVLNPLLGSLQLTKGNMEKPLSS